MPSLLLHHISLVSRNLERSAAFYRDVIGLEEVQRPAFPIAGRWFRSGTVEIHLIDRPDGTLRSKPSIDHNDVHFAIRVPNFATEVQRLQALGFREEGAADDFRRLSINRHGKAGYPQVYILDPDHHVIEINAVRL